MGAAGARQGAGTSSWRTTGRSSQGQAEAGRDQQKWADEGRLLTGDAATPRSTACRQGSRGQELAGARSGVQPDVPATKWRLDVGGLVEAPLSWSWSDFKAEPQATIVSDIHCVTAWSRFDNTWTACRRGTCCR